MTRVASQRHSKKKKREICVAEYIDIDIKSFFTVNAIYIYIYIYIYMCVCVCVCVTQNSQNLGAEMHNITGR